MPEPVRTAAQTWEQTHPREALRLLASGTPRWWIAGGWALDRRPLAEAIRCDRARIPYLAPEIQLLYKAQRPRAEDERDFGTVAPRLDAGARTWLHDALLRIDPAHHWLEALAATRGKECA